MYTILLAGASVCSLLSPLVEGIVHMRDKGMSETEVVEVIGRLNQSDELKARGVGAARVLYTNAPSVDDMTRREFILLGCDNKEIIRGYQYPSERSRGRARDLSHAEFGSRRSPQEPRSTPSR